MKQYNKIILLIMCMVATFFIGNVEVKAYTCTTSVHYTDYKVGGKYQCDPAGNGKKQSFYIIEIKDDNILLLGSDCLKDEDNQVIKQPWLMGNTPNGYIIFNDLKNKWTKVKAVSIPTPEQIAHADGNTSFNIETDSPYKIKNDWLAADGYWTQSQTNSSVWAVFYGSLGKIQNDVLNTIQNQYKPVITVDKSEVQIYEPEPYGSSSQIEDQEKIAELQDALKKLQEQLTSSNAQIKSLQSQLASAYTNMEQQQSKLQSLQSQIDALLKQLQESNQKLEELQNQQSTDLSTLTKKIEDLMNQLNELNKKIQEQSSSGTVDQNLKDDVSDVNDKITDLQKEVSKKLQKTGASDPSQTVKVGNTLKMAYIGYLLGAVILVMGIMVLVQTFIKHKKAKDSSI